MKGKFGFELGGKWKVGKEVEAGDQNQAVGRERAEEPKTEFQINMIETKVEVHKCHANLILLYQNFKSF